jgi:hypothetical protein
MPKTISVPTAENMKAKVEEFGGRANSKQLKIEHSRITRLSEPLTRLGEPTTPE